MLRNIFLFLLFATNAYALDPSLISVNGIAERSIEPNMVVLNIEIFGKSLQAKIAQDHQSKEFNRIKTIVEKYKIKKDDFTTENYSINPEYVYDQKTQQNKISGYRVSHQIKIISKKTDDAGDLVDALTSTSKIESAGVVLQSISWDSDKKSAAEAQAMIDAVKAAQAKADNLAKAAGVKIKNIHLISHQSSAEAAVRPQFDNVRSKSFALSDAQASTSLSAGQIKVRTEVLMQFEIN